MSSSSPGRACVLVLALLGCQEARPPVPVAARPDAPRVAPPIAARPAAPPPVTAPVGPWVAFTSERWNFTAEFPTAPATEVMSLPAGGAPIEMHLFSSEHDGWAYMISALDGPATGGPATPAKILDGARDGAVANVAGRLVAETQLQHSGLPARRIEIVASPPEGEQRLIGLLVLRERRLYQALVVAPSPAPDLPAVAERFFAALKIAAK